MSDMEAYLSKNDDMKSAKEGKNLYESGHVTDIEYNIISQWLKFCYVRGNVVLQTRIGEDPYSNQDNALFRFSLCPLGTP